MFRRVMVSILLAALLLATVGAYVGARRIDASSDPGWIEDAGGVPATVATGLLSARRAPGWLTAPISDARLAQRLSALAASPGVPSDTCLVLRRNGELVFAQRGAQPLSPASLMKIVTAAAILSKAGPAATYTTEVFARVDDLEAAVGGVLIGDIYLVGRGDPVLSTPAYVRRFGSTVAGTDFTELSRLVGPALRNRGVPVVEGSVVADESRFPEAERDYAGLRVGSSATVVWDGAVVTENAAGPLSALLLNDGYVTFSPQPDPAGSRQNTRALDPARHTAEVFGALLRSRGVAVSGQPAKGVAPPLSERVSLGVVESPPMAEIVARMLRYSDNTIAEMLLKEIGRRSGGSAREQAVLGVYDVLQRLMDIPTDGVIISDGSGLASQSRLTCDLIVELLERAGPLSPLVRGMALVGETPTLEDCAVEEVTAAAPVWAHGGDSPSASALAGMTVSGNGDVFTFATISNSAETAGRMCDAFHRELIATVAGRSDSGAADDLLDPLPAVVSPAETPPAAG